MAKRTHDQLPPAQVEKWFENVSNSVNRHVSVPQAISRDHRSHSRWPHVGGTERETKVSAQTVEWESSHYARETCSGTGETLADNVLHHETKRTTMSNTQLIWSKCMWVGEVWRAREKDAPAARPVRCFCLHFPSLTKDRYCQTNEIEKRCVQNCLQSALTARRICTHSWHSSYPYQSCSYHHSCRSRHCWSFYQVLDDIALEIQNKISTIPILPLMLWSHLFIERHLPFFHFGMTECSLTPWCPRKTSDYFLDSFRSGSAKRTYCDTFIVPTKLQCILNQLLQNGLHIHSILLSIDDSMEILGIVRLYAIDAKLNRILFWVLLLRLSTFQGPLETFCSRVYLTWSYNHF